MWPVEQSQQIYGQVVSGAIDVVFLIYDVGFNDVLYCVAFGYVQFKNIIHSEN